MRNAVIRRQVQLLFVALTALISAGGAEAQWAPPSTVGNAFLSPFGCMCQGGGALVLRASPSKGGACDMYGCVYNKPLDRPVTPPASSNPPAPVPFQPVPLMAFFNYARSDALDTATEGGKQAALEAGYQFLGYNGCVSAVKASGTTPLLLTWNARRQDNFTFATVEGWKAAISAGYQTIRLEGYVYPTPMPNMTLLPLKLYYHPVTEDNRLAIQNPAVEADLLKAGYWFIRVEGYVPPSC